MGKTRPRGNEKRADDPGILRRLAEHTRVVQLDRTFSARKSSRARQRLAIDIEKARRERLVQEYVDEHGCSIEKAKKALRFE